MPSQKHILFFILVSLLITEIALGSRLSVNLVARTPTLDGIFLSALASDTPQVKKVQVDTAKVENSFASKVEYSAEDSMRFDLENQKVYLFGKAKVNYESVDLYAGYIEIDMGKSMVYAKGSIDSLGNETDKPVFKEGDQQFTSYEMSYNFKTKKGLIKEVTTKEGEGYIHGERVKKDTSNVVYIKNGKYTTCDLEHPHFYIYAKKLKVIQNDKIITGPANLVVLDIPTPLGVPFGFFPNKKGRASGILVPTYGESPQFGFFLRNGGYYFGVNDYLDMALMGDVYSYGSGAGRVNSNYRKLYKYNGTVNISYSRLRVGERDLPTSVLTKDFFIRWSHSQDAKAHPGSRFSANVNAGTSTYNRYNSYNANDYLSNTFQSNITYFKMWDGKPFNLALSASHSQNTQTKIVNITLPQLTFTMNRMTPFKKENRVSPKWYHQFGDKFGFSWATDARNNISIADSLLFDKEGLSVRAQKTMQNGMKHSLPVSMPVTLFKYITFTPSANLNSTWYLNTIDKHWDEQQKKVIADTLHGFRMANDFIVSANVNTKIYGMYQFRRGKVKALRHQVIPNVAFSYRPDFSEPGYGYYKSVQSDTLGHITKYSIFEKGIYGGPGAGKFGNISGNILNSLEMKVKTMDDSGFVKDKKIMLIQAFSISSAYNLAADSFHLSAINLNGRTQLFKKLDVLFNGNIDPYHIRSDGKRFNKYEWNESQRVGTLTDANLALSTTLKSQKANKTKTTTKGTEAEKAFINANPNSYIDFDIPWSLTFYYTLSYKKNYVTEQSPMLLPQYTQALRFNGDFSLTKKWKVAFNSGYDFVAKKMSYTSIDIYRDLHCWEMKFNWIPFGLRKSYSLTINVKSSILQDLRMVRRRDWFDNQGGK